MGNACDVKWLNFWWMWRTHHFIIYQFSTQHEKYRCSVFTVMNLREEIDLTRAANINLFAGIKNAQKLLKRLKQKVWELIGPKQRETGSGGHNNGQVKGDHLDEVFFSNCILATQSGVWNLMVITFWVSKYWQDVYDDKLYVIFTNDLINLYFFSKKMFIQY